MSPLRSGLSVTPFAINVASAVIAGRLVRSSTADPVRACRDGGQAVTTALLLRHATAGRRNGSIGALVAGLGGGMVTSPNVTLTGERAGENGGAPAYADRATDRGGSRHRYARRDLLPRSEPNRS